MKSMTGFGRGEVERDQMSVIVEIKSVNHRFLDCQFHMPRRLNELESTLRQSIKEYIARGRLDIYITIALKTALPKTTQIDWNAIEQIIEETKKESQLRFGTVPNLEHLLEQMVLKEEFILIDETPLELATYQELVLFALEKALQHLVENRLSEGQQLSDTIKAQQAVILAEYQAITLKTTIIEQEQEEKLLTALRQRVGDLVDESRILTEVAVLLERGDIHEELDRLAAHLTRLTQLLEKATPIGRELDFLIQEFNREVNTIGSKTTNIDIKNRVVTLKTTIEKMREQVQNIE